MRVKILARILAHHQDRVITPLILEKEVKVCSGRLFGIMPSRRTCLEHLNEPPFNDLTANVIKKKSWPAIGGAFSDIWECDLISGEHSRLVELLQTNWIYAD